MAKFLHRVRCHMCCGSLMSFARRTEAPSRLFSPAKIPTIAVTCIQRNVGSLSAKRPVRKKAPITKEPGVLTASAYATADEYELDELITFIEDDGLYRRHNLPSDADDAIYLSAYYEIDAEPREIVVFRQGAVVFWNIPKEEQFNFLKMLRGYEVEPYGSLMVNDESDSMDYRFQNQGDIDETQNNKSKIRKNNIVFNSQESLMLEKYSYSNGLMHSVKLGIWEATLAEYIESIEDVTDSLREGGKLKLSRKEVLQKTGELYNLSHQINLSSDLLDIPDFYWDRDHLEVLYRQAHTYFNINSRTKVMNNKLSHCIDLLDLLRDHLNTQHEVRLEWMIIILILVEVLFEVLRLIQQH